METGKYSGDPADLSAAHVERVGPYTFALAFRDVGDDRGPTLHVFGPVGGRREEILRFDCFAQSPHYHLGWSYIDAPFIPIDDPQPMAWTVRSLTAAFGEFVLRAEADFEASDAPQAEMEAALARLYAASTRLQAQD